MAVEAFENPEEMGLDNPAPLPPPESGGARARRKAKARWRKIGLAAGGVAAVLLGAGYLAVRFALRDPRFQLTLALQGSKYATAVELEDKFAGDREGSVFQVPLERRRRQVEQIPWVRSATLRRVLPNQIRVNVTERTAVAFLAQPDGLALVDEDGVVLNVPKESSFKFPVVRGMTEDEPADARREKMHLFTSLTKDLVRGGLQSADTISEVDLEDPHDARVVVSDSSGTVLLHLGTENFLARYLIYLGHIEEWKQKIPNIQAVDLRYDGQVVVNADPQQDPKEKGKGKVVSAGIPASAPPAAATPIPQTTPQ